VIGKVWVMSFKYDAQTREKAVRLARAHREEYASE
jgi:hypothetical protein